MTAPIAYRPNPLLPRACEVFGNPEKAARWMVTPLAILANRPPADVLKTEQGYRQVEDLLTRIEHNIPS